MLARLPIAGAIHRQYRGGVAPWSPACIGQAGQWLKTAPDGVWLPDSIGTGTSRDPQSGRCYKLTSSNSEYVEFGGEANDVFTGDWTVCLSIHSEDSGYLLDKLQGSIVVNYGSSFSGNFYVGNSSGGVRVATTATGRWVITHDTSETGFARYRIWKDGAEQSLTTFGSYVAPTTTTTPLRFGRRSSGSPYYNGAMSDVTLHTAVATADEITALTAFDVENYPAIGNCALWARCDEQAGSTCYDSSGNGNHGTITGTLGNVHGTTQNVWSNHNQFGYSDGGGGVFVPRDESDTDNDVLGSALDYTGRVPLPAKIIQSHCLDFNGSTEYVTWGAIGTSVKTIALRIKPDGVAGTDHLLWLNATDYVTIVSGTVTLNGFSGATTAIYVDGVAGSTVTANWHSVVITSDTGFALSNGYLGGNATNYYAGAVCDVRMSTTEWSAGNAATYHAEGGEDSTLTFTHQWPCAEGASTAIFDVAYGTGTEALGVITGTVASMWSAQTQDVFAYNANQGFLLEASGRHVPAMLTGATSAGGGAISNPNDACWNHPESHIDFDPYNTPELSAASNDYDPDVDDLALDGSQWVRKRSDVLWNDFVTYNAGLTGACLTSAHTGFDVDDEITAMALNAWKMGAVTWDSGDSRWEIAPDIGSLQITDATNDEGSFAGSAAGGKSGNALNVNDDASGSSACNLAVDCSADTNFDKDNLRAFAAWYYVTTAATSSGSNENLLVFTSAGKNWTLRYNVTTDKLELTDGTTTLTDGAALSATTWYLVICAVHDTTGNAALYVVPAGGGVAAIRKQSSAAFDTGTEQMTLLDVMHTIQADPSYPQEHRLDELIVFSGDKRLSTNAILHFARENYVS